MVYYIQADGIDAGLATAYQTARAIALDCSQWYQGARITVQVFSGRKHGDGGSLVKSLVLVNNRLIRA